MLRFFALAIFLSNIYAQVQITPLFDLPGATSDPESSPDGKTLAFEWCKPNYTGCGIYTRAFSGGEPTLATPVVKGPLIEGSPYSPRWSPDGKRLALTRMYSHYDTHLVVRELGGGAEHDFGNVCGYASTGVWSPDGKFLLASVYKSEDTLECRPALFSMATGARAAFLAQSGDAPSLSPDGRMVAYADGRALMLLRLTSDYRPSGPPLVLVREPREVDVEGWTRDSKQIVYGVALDAPTQRSMAIAPGSRPQNIDPGDRSLSITQRLPDGSALATQTIQNSALWRADLRSSPPKIEKVPDLECSSGVLNCSPDGRRRAFISTGSTGFLQITIANMDGSNEQVLVKALPQPDAGPHPYPNLSGWSPDGRWIAFTVNPAEGNADARSYLYVVPSAGGAVRRLGKDAQALDFPIWSHDSKSLYATQGSPIDGKPHPIDQALVRVDLADGVITPLGHDGIWARLPSNGRYLYFSGKVGRGLFRTPPEGGATERLLEDNLTFPGPLPASKLVYYVRDTSLIRFDLNSRQSTTLLKLDFPPRNSALSPDENFIYFTQQDAPVRRAVVVSGLK